MGGNRHGTPPPKRSIGHFGVLVGTYPGQWAAGILGATGFSVVLGLAIYRAIVGG
jgi:hypothetical protein